MAITGTTPIEVGNKLQLNHTYLIRRYKSDIISSATILLVTEKAYKILWNSGKYETITWELIQIADDKFIIIEDITIFVNYKQSVVPLVEPCRFCGGVGSVPDENSTAGNRVCPRCNGSKLVTSY